MADWPDVALGVGSALAGGSVTYWATRFTARHATAEREASETHQRRMREGEDYRKLLMDGLATTAEAKDMLPRTRPHRFEDPDERTKDSKRYMRNGRGFVRRFTVWDEPIRRAPHGNTSMS